MHGLHTAKRSGMNIISLRWTVIKIIELRLQREIDSKFCTYGSIEDVEKMLEEAREKAGVTVPDVRESWKLKNDIYGI